MMFGIIQLNIIYLSLLNDSKMKARKLTARYDACTRKGATLLST